MKRSAFHFFLLIGISASLLGTSFEKASCQVSVQTMTCCEMPSAGHSCCCSTKTTGCPMMTQAPQPEQAILTNKVVPTHNVIALGTVQIPGHDPLISEDHIAPLSLSVLTEHHLALTPPLRAPPVVLA